MAKNFFVTTPMYYANGMPHIGHCYTSIIADIIARHQVQSGMNVHFLTGSDEHGKKISETAAANNKSCVDFVEQNHKLFIEMNSDIDLSTHSFIRTTSPKHIQKVLEVWGILQDKGYIYKGKYEGWYAINDESFYKESEVREVSDGVYIAISSGNKVAWVEQESYFFKLSALQDKIMRLCSGDFIISPSIKREMIEFISSGLQDISISRQDVDWGIKVPSDPSHTIYVWIDALISYLVDMKEGWWPADTQVLGKDISRFHAIYWPAILMALDLPLPRQLLVHGWILCDGRKMSKSLGNTIDYKDIVASYGSDTIRYIMAKSFSAGEDFNINHERIADIYNNEIANNLGNLIHRTASIIVKKMNGVVENGFIKSALLSDIYQDIHAKLSRSSAKYDAYDIKTVIEDIMQCVRNLNAYMNKTEPWKSEQYQVYLSEVAVCIRYIAIHLWPIMPKFARHIGAIFGENEENFYKDIANHGIISKDIHIHNPTIFFNKK